MKKFWAHNNGASLIPGVVIGICFFAMTLLPNWRGREVAIFVAYYSIAGLAYVISILRLDKKKPGLRQIWGFAILFQVILLFSSPSLSDDVYRYIWDGHLINQGVNPYLLPVNSPELDSYHIPLRGLVNHDWMASPYLPVSQLVFAIITFISPHNVLAFQITVVLFSLLTAWMIMEILKQLGFPRRYVLLYLWNPLVNVEFAHGAHMDSLMLCLMMAALLFSLRGSQGMSALALSAATLTKILPLLLVPFFLRKWGWRGVLIYLGIVVGTLSIFSLSAGWGLTGPLDGTGIFGATRIYLRYWNYNSSIYHWLEVLFSGYSSPGGVPVEIVGETPILLAKAFTSGFLGMSLLLTGWLAWHTNSGDLRWLQLSLIPLGAYLLLTATVHPWYVTLVLPFLPFVLTRTGEPDTTQRFIWPWVYFSIAVAFSYLTYQDPDNLREIAWVRLVEYAPLYCLLVWALANHFQQRKKPHPPTI